MEQLKAYLSEKVKASDSNSKGSILLSTLLDIQEAIVECIEENGQE